jgi:hypothetical protein
MSGHGVEERADEGLETRRGCPWAVLDRDGSPRCRYAPLRESLRALGVAQFTLFDQSYVSRAIAYWRENFPEDYTYDCTPSNCPSRVARFLSLFPG